MSTNDVTGDRLVTKPATDAFREHYDQIFRQERKSAVLSEEEYQKLLDKTEIEYLKGRCRSKNEL